MIAADVRSRPTLPPIPDPRPDNVADVLRRIKDIFDVREGETGDPLDRTVTFRDLWVNGSLSVSRVTGAPYVTLPGAGMTYLPADVSEAPEYSPPPAVAGLTVTAGLATNIIQFTMPSYHNHGITEIWRSATDDLGAAVIAGTTDSFIYPDAVGVTLATRYYWVRNVSQAGVRGPFNAVSGTSDTTLQVATADVEDLAITNAKIGLLAVDTANIANLAVATAKMADLAVTNAKIDNVTITGGKIAASTITADKMSVTQLSAITADLGAITAGTVTLSSSGHIKSGQSAYATGTGFWLGIDSGTAKLSLGDSTKYLRWDGSTLTLGGDIVATGNLQANAVTTAKVTDDAITTPVSAYTSGTVTVGTSTSQPVEVQSVSLTTTGKPVFLTGTFQFNPTAGWSSGVAVDIKRDSTVIYSTTIALGESDQSMLTFSFSETPAAGTYSYKMMVSDTNAPTTTVEKRSLFAMEVKK